MTRTRTERICWLLTAAFMTFFTCAFTCEFAAAQTTNSMWQRRDPRMTNPYADVKAVRKGDLLTVLISEKTDVENKARRSLDKKGDSDMDIEGNFGLSGALGNKAGGLTFDDSTSAQKKFAGNTQYKDERKLEDRFTVTVEDVLPNGNLLIVGTRKLLIEGDQKTIVLTGVARKFDVSTTNTISSQNIANLNISFYSSGPSGSEKHFLNQGWLGRKMNGWW